AFAPHAAHEADEAAQDGGAGAVEEGRADEALGKRAAPPHRALARSAGGRRGSGVGQSVTRILPKTLRDSSRARAASMSASAMTLSITGRAMPAAILSSTVARLPRLQPNEPMRRSWR